MLERFNRFIKQVDKDTLTVLDIEADAAAHAADGCGCPTCHRNLEEANNAYVQEYYRQVYPQPDHEEDFVTRTAWDNYKKGK